VWASNTQYIAYHRHTCETTSANPAGYYIIVHVKNTKTKETLLLAHTVSSFQTLRRVRFANTCPLIMAQPESFRRPAARLTWMVTKIWYVFQLHWRRQVALWQTPCYLWNIICIAPNAHVKYVLVIGRMGRSRSNLVRYNQWSFVRITDRVSMNMYQGRPLHHGLVTVSSANHANDVDPLCLISVGKCVLHIMYTFHTDIIISRYVIHKHEAGSHKGYTIPEINGNVWR
jgi:hypothetical protein